MLRKENYYNVVKRPYPPLYTDIVFRGSGDYRNFVGLVEEKYAMDSIVVCDDTWFYSKSLVDRAARLVFKTWQNPRKLKQAIVIINKRERELLAATTKDFNSFCEAFQKYMPTLSLGWSSEKLILNRVSTLLSKKLSKDETEKLLGELNIPLKNNFYRQEEYDLVRSENLKAHVKKYEWIRSRYGLEDPYTLMQAQARLKEIDKKEFLTNWKKAKATLRKKIFWAKKLVGKQNHGLIDLMQFLVFFRTQRTDIINRSAYCYISRLKQLARARNLNYQEILNCTKDEVLGKLPNKSVIRERQRGFSLVMQQGSIRIHQGKENDRIKKIFAEAPKKIKEFKGMIACRGKVRARVRIIGCKKDYVKMKSGDILVTSMTTPDMVTIMKKASAFITDEGGITCHAAIISREMNKPCVIGTKIATKVLKDGDLVEVDANKGIVRKI